MVARYALLALAFGLFGCLDEGAVDGSSSVQDLDPDLTPSAYLVSADQCYPSVRSGFSRWEPADPDRQWFGEISALRVVTEDRWVVMDHRRLVLHFLDPDGSGIQVGSEGEGSGEFRHLTRLWVAGSDSVAVFDRLNGRISVFDTDGGFLGDRSARLGDPLPQLLGTLQDGRWVELRRVTRNSPGSTAGFWRDSLQVMVEGVDQDVPLTPALPGADRYLVDPRHGFGVFYAPWGLRPTYRTEPNGLVLIAPGEAARVELIGPQGSTSLSIPDLSRPVSAADLRREQEETRRRFEDPPGLDHMYGELSPPARTPQYLRALVDNDGWLWLQRYPLPGEAPLYFVLDSEGVVRGEVDLPAETRLRGASGPTVVLSGTDDLGVPVIYTGERRCPP